MRWSGSWYEPGYPVRCIDGKLWKSTPMDDDPYLETEVGPCPDCQGAGCQEDRDDD